MPQEKVASIPLTYGFYILEAKSHLKIVFRIFTWEESPGLPYRYGECGRSQGETYGVPHHVLPCQSDMERTFYPVREWLIWNSHEEYESLRRCNTNSMLFGKLVLPALAPPFGSAVIGAEKGVFGCFARNHIYHSDQELL
ncbi:hypothetical protein Y032_0005g2585 [Ancylostoma ceylanicum]|uniref:Uncharacterized protein n=1 Tax=Ancylostoma ceylanicum TaxID=53326 RepID=A0A016VTF3_9BILA|nr:hypothetical protein Y032_0005g2585 [Ancylostoma ceylanicum]